MPDDNTIAAVATPPGTGAIAVVRMSGAGARKIAKKCCGRDLEARRATLVRLRDQAGVVVDEAVATYFAAPASYTGEDVVEISCHGGMLVTRRVLECLLAAGAHPAEPGEFSRRAFANGKLDLTQAEAVMDIISAGSDLALRAAQNQLQGAISARVQAAADRLISTAAHLGAYIDFPEEEISPDTTEQLADAIHAVRQDLQQLLDTADEGRFLREGVRTAIIGAPNVGKSSLLNMLLGYERAIVSDVAGTTRDTIEECVSVAGLRLRLTDTAGLHESADAIECAGMERSRRAGTEADLVLEVADITQAPPPPLPLPHHVERLLLLNKADLAPHPAWETTPGIRLSCRTGAGRIELEQAIAALFLHRDTATADFAAINARHRFALQQAIDSLDSAYSSLLMGESPELTDVDLRAALDALGSVVGRIDTEDILTRVFSTFCLGK